MKTLKLGMENRAKIYNVLLQKKDWMSIKEIGEKLNLHHAHHASISSHTNNMVRQQLIQEKTIYKIVAGYGRKIRHYKILE